MSLVNAVHELIEVAAGRPDGRRSAARLQRSEQVNDVLVFVTGCLCAGSGCGGHLDLPQPYQGAAQHTYTIGCDGFHEPGQCPRSGS